MFYINLIKGLIFYTQFLIFYYILNLSYFKLPSKYFILLFSIKNLSNDFKNYTVCTLNVNIIVSPLPDNFFNVNIKSNFS